MGFKIMDVNEFKDYINGLKVTRKIKWIQLHHTFSPNYSHFNGNNHEKVQKGMRDYHVNSCGYSDIAQTFTIFPDGKILTGRNINVAPAGIRGANTNGVCIECVGYFDKGNDVMTDAQKNAIVGAVKILLDKFGLSAENNVTYHAWWSSDKKNLGTYVKGKSIKTCPGTDFFGGNTREAYEKNLMPLIKAYGENLKPVESVNDIVWELSNAGVMEGSKYWMKRCEEDINIYWLCRKMANKLRGTL